MACVHLQNLYQLCQSQQLRLGGSDLVRIVCHQCGEQEVCPSTLLEQYEDETGQSPDAPDGQSPDGQSPDGRTTKG